MKFESDSNRDYRIIAIRLRISINRNPEAMAGHPSFLDPTASKRKIAENSPKIREKIERKIERKVLDPIPDPIPVRSCIENRIGPKSALRLVCPHTPLVVRPVRKTLS